MPFDAIDECQWISNEGRLMLNEVRLILNYEKENIDMVQNLQKSQLTINLA